MGASMAKRTPKYQLNEINPILDLITHRPLRTLPRGG